MEGRDGRAKCEGEGNGRGKMAGQNVRVREMEGARDLLD